MAVFGVSLTTILVPAAAPALVAIDDFKTALGITGTQDDAFITTLVAQASAGAANYCNRSFAVETILDEAWPDRDPYPFAIPGGIGRLQLARWPIVTTQASGAAPVAAGMVVMADGVTLVDGTDFRTDVARGQLIRLGGDGYPCSWNPSYLAVTYQAGYATVPADLADAATRMMRGAWFARARDPALRSESTSGVWSASYDAGLPADITAILDNYRVPVLG